MPPPPHSSSTFDGSCKHWRPSGMMLLSTTSCGGTASSSMVLKSTPGFKNGSRLGSSCQVLDQQDRSDVAASRSLPKAKTTPALKPAPEGSSPT
eukprot:2550676-Rhodomonas_salina.5